MKVLIVDDEPLARERLLRLLRKLVPESEVFEAIDGHQAIEQVEKHSPEVVLLDISMPGMDGLEVAGLLQNMQYPPAVVFCTAHDQFALQALQHRAEAYLLKPVREAELQKALQTAGRVNRLQFEALKEPSEFLDDSRQTISHRTHRGFQTLPLDEIRCFIAQDKYVAAVTPDTELLLSESLKELEQEFGDQFLRVHRNALVAPGHIVRLEKRGDGAWYVILNDVNSSPAISRRHLSEVKSRLSDT